MKGSFIRASLVLAGTTIGAGMFGIPYVTAKVGYPLGFLWLLLIVLFTLVLNLAYAYVIIKTDHGRESQLVGLAGKHLGKPWRKAALLVVLVGQWSAMLAYIIGVGGFLAVVLKLEGLELALSIFFFLTMAFITVKGLKVVSVVESWLTYGMIAIIGIIALSAYSKISGVNFAPNGTSFMDSFAIVGVVMGAMTGFAIIPEVRKTIGGSKDNDEAFMWSIVAGTLITAVVYALFQFVVVGVSGSATSESSIAGLVPFLNPSIVMLGSVFGILAMTSSFISLTYVLRDTFELDFKMKKIHAWLLAIIPPFLIFLVGVNSFILVLDVGGFLSGLTGAILIFTIFVAALIKSRKKSH